MVHCSLQPRKTGHTLDLVLRIFGERVKLTRDTKARVAFYLVDHLMYSCWPLDLRNDMAFTC